MMKPVYVKIINVSMVARLRPASNSQSLVSCKFFFIISPEQQNYGRRRE